MSLIATLKVLGNNVALCDVPVMELSEYMKAKGLRDKQAAHELAISRSFLSEIRQGKKQPTLDLAVRIEEWSGGEVKPADLLRKAA